MQVLINIAYLNASGITSAVGEQCLTNAGTLGVLPEPCLEAIAAGDGREIMKFDADTASMRIYRVGVHDGFPWSFVACLKRLGCLPPCSARLFWDVAFLDELLFCRMGKLSA